MIPIQLKIKGLYSYQELQIIDFDKLLKSNIFGVFGSVGSGKSTILEAISYALYGEVDRMSRTGRNYNMLNLKSKELLIDFEFRNFEGVEYRIVVRGKRNSKQFDDVKSFTKTTYKKTHGKWEAFDSFEHNVEQIVGLSYINFRRTIIIPQGKFQEFLQLGSADRTTMLKEIFNLEKFDLSHKLATVDSANEAQLQTATGSLQQLEEYTNDGLTHLENLLNIKNTEIDSLKIKQKNKQVEYEEQKKIKDLSVKLKVTRQKFNELSLEKSIIDELEAKLKDYNIFARIFKSDLDFCKHKEENISKQLQRLRNVDESLYNNDINLQQIRKYLADAKQDKENIPSLSKQVEEYKALAQMQKSYAKIEDIKQRVEKGKATISDIQAESKTLEEKLKLQKDKHNILIGKQDKYYELKEKELTVDKLINTRAELLRINKRKDECNSFSNTKLQELQAIKKQYGIENEDITNKLTALALGLSKNIDKLENEKEHLLINRKLGDFVDQLHSGKACPLCGSAEHPKILVATNVDDELRSIKAQVERSAKERKELERAELNSISIYESISTANKELAKLNKQIASLETEVKNQKKQLSTGTVLSEDEIKLQIKQLSIELNGLKDLTTEIGNTENKMNDNKLKIERYNKAISKFENEFSFEEGQFDLMQARLEYLNFDKTIDSDTITKLTTETENKISSIEKTYEKLTTEIEGLTTEVTKLESTKNELQGNINNDKKDLEISKHRLNANINTYKINDIEDVAALLNSNFDAEFSENKISEFYSKYAPLKKNIKELEQELGDKTFNQDEFCLLETELQDVENKLALCNRLIAQTEQQIRTTKGKLIDKSRLIKNVECLLSRKNNIDIFKKMFRSKGFVDFVSSVYLKNLCQAANKRFTLLTKQQLHLELNDNNDFLVRDNMNEGRLRSVKTLSGGQMFQASLSLALSLAESIQKQNKQDRNFFFLDEGFGTLDKDTLRQVFNTLKALKNENRIVGIISHIEELQQEIPVHLKIHKDLEIGSVIETSY
ncbi:MAG: AAA family ATPase [Bacteroidales bacterium]